MKEVIHDPDIYNHPRQSNLVASCIENYEYAQQSFYNFLKLKSMQERITSSTRKCARNDEERDVRQAHQKRKEPPQEMDLPLLTTSISQFTNLSTSKAKSLLEITTSTETPQQA